MHKINNLKNEEDNYKALLSAIQSHLEDESDLIANLSNISAFIFASLPDINWAGFYILRETELVLGPFCGKPACTRIALGKGVCGTAAVKQEIIVVDDVELFDGHIACDSDSRSEIVLPIMQGGKIFGVLDIDSPICNRFGDLDKEYLGKIVKNIEFFLQGV